MAIFVGPFNSGGGASFDEVDWQQMFSGLFHDGVIKGALNQFAVTAPGGMQVAVDTGRAVINGTFLSSSASTTLSIAAADPTNPRIDLVIASIDFTGRTGAIQVLTGTPAPSPAPPNTTTGQLPLAQVAVAAGASGIISGNITTDVAAGTGPAREWARPMGAEMSFFNGTVSGTGPTTVNHGLGETPNWVFLTANQATPAYFSYRNQNATTVDIYCSPAGAAFSGVAVRRYPS